MKFVWSSPVRYWFSLISIYGKILHNMLFLPICCCKMSKIKLSLKISVKPCNEMHNQAWAQLFSIENSYRYKHVSINKWAASWQTTKMTVRPVWTETSLCAQWVLKDPGFLYADSEDSDQTGQMPRLIWVFDGRTCHFVGFVMRRLKCLNRSGSSEIIDSLDQIYNEYSFKVPMFIRSFYWDFGHEPSQ